MATLDSQEANPGVNTRSILGCSFLGHLFGVILGMALHSAIWGPAESIFSNLAGSVFGLFFGYPQVLAMWWLVALPAGFIAVSCKAHHRVLLLSGVGAVLGVAAISLPIWWNGGSNWVRPDTYMFGAINGGFSAGGFSLLARVWLKPSTQEKESTDRGNLEA